MGERANIVMKTGDSRIYFYTHWDGYELPSIAQEGLRAGKPRWQDAPYLSRIIFCHLVKGDEMEETGYGISMGICDNSFPLLVIDTDKQQVRFEAEGSIYPSKQDAVGKSFSFSEFCEINFGDRDQWRVVAGLPDENEDEEE